MSENTNQIFVDIVACLSDDESSVSPKMLERLQQLVNDGWELLFCSAMGTKHARELVARHGLSHLVTAYYPRPHGMTAHVPCAVLEPFGFDSGDDDSWRETVDYILDKYAD